MRTLIKNTCYVEGDNWRISKGNIEIQDGIIVNISYDVLHRTYDLEIEGSNYLCTPGLVNAHLHPSKEVYSCYKPFDPLSDAIDLIHRQYLSEKDEDRYWFSLYSLKRCLLNGTTGVGVFTSRYETDLEAIKTLGIRGSIFYAINENWMGREKAPQITDKSQIWEALEKYISSVTSPLIRLNIGTSSELTCSPKFLQKLHNFAQRNCIKFSLHAAEGKSQSEQCHKMFGNTSIQYLCKQGILTKNTIIVHASYISDTEMKIIQDSQAGIIHCPLSNSFTSAGLLPLSKLINSSSHVGLGTDCGMLNPINTITNECFFALYAHGGNDFKEKIQVNRLLRMITADNAELIGFDNMGYIKIGNRADINMYPLRNGVEILNDNPISLLIHILKHKPQYVFVDGNLVVKGGRLQTFNEEEINNNYIGLRKRYLEKLLHETEANECLGR